MDNAVKAAGYTTVRYAGADRFDTSLQVVQQGLGNPTTIFLTTGANFPDALSAGAPRRRRTPASCSATTTR